MKDPKQLEIRFTYMGSAIGITIKKRERKN